VLACDSHNGEKYLAAYISLKKEESLNIRELRAFLAEHIPDSMIPTAFVFMEHLPLTVNGKIDRNALPTPPISGSETNEREEPKSSVGIILKDIWTEVLGINDIGLHDDFFMLGGHSLLATRILWRVRNIFKIDIPLQVLFEKPTIASLAATIEDILKQGVNQKTDAIVPLPRKRLQR
jgi:acyl carrier protein